MIHRAADLTPDQRAAIESLLGRSLTDADTVSLRTLPAVTPEEKELRDAGIRELKAYFARIDARSAESSPEQADDVMDEALRSARPGYRPVR